MRTEAPDGVQKSWARDNYSFTSSLVGGLAPFTPGPAAGTTIGPTAALTDTHWGWMGGAGVEQALTANWSAKLEYDFMDFGTKTYSFVAGPAPAFFTPTAGVPTGSSTHTIDITQRIHLIKVGLNYRFY